MVDWIGLLVQPVLFQRLSEQATFPLLESCAMLLCDFFTRSAVPADPIPEVERYLKFFGEEDHKEQKVLV